MARLSMSDTYHSLGVITTHNNSQLTVNHVTTMLFLATLSQPQHYFSNATRYEHAVRPLTSLSLPVPTIYKYYLLAFQFEMIYSL